MVYQQFINYPSLTVYENIASPLRVKGLAKTEIEARVASAAVGNAPESRSQAQVKRAEKRRVKPGTPPKKQPVSKAANHTKNTDKRERRRSRC